MEDEKLEMMEDLLVLHYGRSFISNYEVLQEMLEVEFDYIISLEDLKKTSKFVFDLEMEDLELTIRNCDINY